jgi:hypothetical protein
VDKDFDSKILKFIASELYFLTAMTAAREMYGKSYFSLGVAEKQAIDSAVWNQTFGNFQQITPQLLGEQPAAPIVGFQSGAPVEKSS